MRSLPHLSILAHKACRFWGHAQTCARSTDSMRQSSRMLSTQAVGGVDGEESHKCGPAIDSGLLGLKPDAQRTSSQDQVKLSCQEAVWQPDTTCCTHSFAAQGSVGQHTVSLRHLNDLLSTTYPSVLGRGVIQAKLEAASSVAHSPLNSHISPHLDSTVRVSTSLSFIQSSSGLLLDLPDLSHLLNLSKLTQRQLKHLPGVATHRGLKRPVCAYLGCSKISSYCVKGAMSSMYCAQHKEAGMVYVLNARCIGSGCMKRPSFNFTGFFKALYCKDHKQPTMVNVTSARCQHAGCTISPIFNMPGETCGLYCRSHMHLGMVDVVSEKCEDDRCGKKASFNIVGAKGLRYCADHAQPGMEDRHSKRCEEANCRVFASYGLAGSSRRRFCARHREPGMVEGKAVVQKKEVHRAILDQSIML